MTRAAPLITPNVLLYALVADGSRIVLLTRTDACETR